MVGLSDLWVPVVASAVAVFLLSSLIHMVIKWHDADFRALPDEDAVRGVLQRAAVAPGQYVVPHCSGMKAAQSPEMQQKFREGPVAFVVLRPAGMPAMGRALALWFAYSAAVSLIAGYLASRTLMPGEHGVAVFRLISTVAFATYVGGNIQAGIWMGKPWRSVAKDVLDGAIYGAATGLVYALTWPH